jgi:CubicO group peptidase (beta-lactamase class C family)
MRTVLARAVERGEVSGLVALVHRHGRTHVVTLGWTGGLGTSAYTDPAEDLAGVLMTQTAMTSPLPPPVFQDFWTSTYAAIDD